MLVNISKIVIEELLDVEKKTKLNNIHIKVLLYDSKLFIDYHIKII